MKYIIFGAGVTGMIALDFFGYDRVDFFIDNEKYGRPVNGKGVIQLSELKDRYSGQIIIIASENYHHIMQEQLVDSGYSRFFVFHEKDQNILYSYFDDVCIYKRSYRVDYTEILADYQIDKYKRIAVYGEDFIVSYLISEIAVQGGFENIACIVESTASNYLLFPEIPRMTLDEAERKTDCLLICIRRKDDDIREKVCKQERGYAVIDMFDIDAFVHAYRHTELSCFKNIHKGEQAFIVGNGPSLRIEDLDMLHEHHEICFGENKIYKIFDKTEWRPDYLCISDHFMIPACDMYVNKRQSIVFYTDDYHWTDNEKYDGVNYVHFKSDEYGQNMPGFSDDITEHVYCGYTVTYDLCLQIAAYMGFQKIYLIGVDSSYSGNDTDVGNHFVKDYYNDAERELYKRQRHHGEHDMEANAYRKADTYSRKHGFRIYNATRGGKLEAFERIEFDSLF